MDAASFSAMRSTRLMNNGHISLRFFRLARTSLMSGAAPEPSAGICSATATICKSLASILHEFRREAIHNFKFGRQFAWRLYRSTIIVLTQQSANSASNMGRFWIRRGNWNEYSNLVHVSASSFTIATASSCARGISAAMHSGH